MRKQAVVSISRRDTNNTQFSKDSRITASQHTLEKVQT
jgi:hypothetical protein